MFDRGPAWLVLAVLAAIQPSDAGLAQTAPPAAAGDGTARPWLLAVGAQRDEEANSSLLASISVPATEKTWFSASAGRSRATEGGADVLADLLELGVDHRFGLVGLSVAGQRWGDAGSLESSDWSGTVYFRTDRLRIGIELERRDIDVHFRVTDLLGRVHLRKASLEADGRGLSLMASATETLRFYAYAMDWDYSRNLRVLPLIERLNLLSTSALTLANGFVEAP